MITFDFMVPCEVVPDIQHKQWLKSVIRKEGLVPGDISYLFCDDAYLLEQARWGDGQAYLKLADLYHKGQGVQQDFLGTISMLAMADQYGAISNLEDYMKTLRPADQAVIQSAGGLSLGTVEGRMASAPEGSSIADMIRWYKSTGGEWDIDALENKWFAVSDAQNGIHAVSIFSNDEDGIVTNGMNHYCCRIDYAHGSYAFLPDIPHYGDLTPGQQQ